MKKYLLTILSLLLISTTYAIPQDPCNPKPCCEKAPEGPYAFAYLKENEVACAKNTYLYADLLYMNVYQDMEYANLIGNKTTGLNRQVFKPGFRIGFNALFSEKFYLDIQWKFLKYKRDSQAIFSGDAVVATLLPPDDANVMPRASSRFSANFNTLDARIFKSYFVSKYFISSPMIGFRAAWIDQNYLARYFILENKNTVKYSNNYYGFGLSASYEARFLIHKYVDFYANTLLALLFSKFDVLQYSNSPIDSLLYRVKDSYFTVTPDAEMGLGFLINGFYDKNKYKISAKIGYEFHYWWNQNQLKRFMDLNPVAIKEYSEKDLSINGFVFGLLLTF